jgi:outer membrane receptor for ferric coprogen and ferric-rhodotorulic acid
LNRDPELVLSSDYQKENFSDLFGMLSNTSKVNIYSWDRESLSEPDVDYASRYQYSCVSAHPVNHNSPEFSK